MKESLRLNGTIHFLGKHPDGTIFIDKTIPNTVEIAGKAVVTGLMMPGVGGSPFNAVAIGTGSGGTTSLNNEITTNGGQRQHYGGSPSITTTQVTTTNLNDTAQWGAVFIFTASFAITEEGIFNSSSSNSGVMLAYQSFPAINVNNGDELAVTHNVQLS